MPVCSGLRRCELTATAGVNPAMGEILEVSSEMLDKILDTNISSAFFLTQLAVPHMPP